LRKWQDQSGAKERKVKPKTQVPKTGTLGHPALAQAKWTLKWLARVSDLVGPP